MAEPSFFFKLGSVSYLNGLNILFEEIRERTLVSRKDDKMADFAAVLGVWKLHPFTEKAPKFVHSTRENVT